MHTLAILLTDLRHTLRQLGRAKTFALTAILTLALGVGANVVVFGVLDAMLLRPLPGVPQPQQLSFLQHRQRGHWGTTFAFPQYQDLALHNRTFTGIAAYDMAAVGLTVSGRAEERWAYMVTGSYFDLLGVKPYLGRFFGAADDAHGEGGSPWVVLSYATWKQEFGGDPSIVGRTVRVSQHPLTVVGVAPPGFYGTERFIRPALWFDLWNEKQLTPYGTVHNRRMQNLWVIGRRKPGVAVAQAEADLDRVAAQMARVNPQTDQGMQIELTLPGYVGDALRTPLKAFLAGLMLLAAVVLTAACANLSGLYAARAAERTREIAIRVALGSSRVRVLGGLLLESTVLALAGGALGCVIARTALKALTNYRPPFDFPVGVAVDPGVTVYGFAVLLALACGLTCGIVPVRETRHADANQLMKGIVSAGVRGGRRWGLRDMLLLIEVALCCVLVTSSFVSLRGLSAELSLPLGFNPHGVTRVAFNPTVAGYSGEQTRQFERKILDAASTVPGVENAALAGNTPLDVAGGDNVFIYKSGVADFRPENRAFIAHDFSVSPGYFSTAGTRLLTGRAFTWADDEKSPDVAVVNQTFAKELFGNRSAVGEFFQDGGSRKYRIVGVVEDGKYASLNEPSAPAVFRALAQEPWSHGALLVRMTHPQASAHNGGQAQLDRVLVGILHEAGPAVPVNDVGPWEANLAPMLFPTRAATVALSILGALALLLAVTGIFGLASYTVSRRMREFGIRVAVGAPRRAVLQAALGRIGRILIVGSVAGILLGLAGSRVLAAIVYGASAFDPLVLLAVCCTMLLVGLLSVALPARRAMLVEPAILLREE